MCPSFVGNTDYHPPSIYVAVILFLAINNTNTQVNTMSKLPVLGKRILFFGIMLGSSIGTKVRTCRVLEHFGRNVVLHPPSLSPACSHCYLPNLLF